MLSQQQAIDLDQLDVMTSGFGFTPWGPDTCPTLDQLMASSTSSSSAGDTAPCGTAATEGDDDEERRRQRRKISNRLSAQRSRARKQQRLEELRAASARLRSENRRLAVQMHAAARRRLAVGCQNAWLRAEAAALARRLREARRLLALQRLSSQLLPYQQRLGVAQYGGAGGAAFATAAPVGLASSLMT